MCTGERQIQECKTLYLMHEQKRELRSTGAMPDCKQRARKSKNDPLQGDLQKSSSLKTKKENGCA